MRFFKLAGGILGVYLFARVLQTIGWETIRRSFELHFQVLLILTVAYSLYEFLRTWTLKICIGGPAGFKNLLLVRLAGEAIGYVAVGSVLGDAAKVALAKDRVPASQGAKGVFAEKLIYYLSGAVFVTGGFIIGLLYLGQRRFLFYSFTITILFFIAVILLLSSGVRPVTRLFQKWKKKRPDLHETIRKTEESLFEFRKRHPKEFVAVSALNLVSYFYTVGEVLYILSALGIPAAGLSIWYYQAFVKFTNTASVFVPGTLGVFESTNVMLSNQLHFGEAAGITIALFIRIRGLIWSAIGYLCLLYLINRQKSGKERNSARKVERLKS